MPTNETKVKRPRKSARTSTDWRTRQLALLYELCVYLTSTLDEKELLSRTVRIINDYFNFAVVAINLMDVPNQELVLTALSSSLPDNVNIKSRMPLGQGVIGRAGKERQPILVPDTEKCDFYIAKFPAPFSIPRKSYRPA
jgi:GAF domain-containing protein